MYINMKLINMLQNDQRVTEVMKKKIENLLEENDASAWPIRHWRNQKKKQQKKND